MAFYQSTLTNGKTPAPVAAGSEIVVQRALVPLTAAIAADDIVEACVLPAGHELVGYYLDSDDLDTNATPTITWNCGIMSGDVGTVDAARTVGTQLYSAATTSQAGGLNVTMLRGALRIPPDHTKDRSIGLKAAADAATGVATLTLTTFKGFWQPSTVYAAGDYIVLPNGLRAVVKAASGGTSATAFPDAMTTTAYNTDITDGTVTWLVADPSIALTIWYRAAR